VAGYFAQTLISTTHVNALCFMSQDHNAIPYREAIPSAPHVPV